MTVCLNVATWLTLWHVLILSETSTDLDLTGDPIPVAEGGLLTLSCSKITNIAPLLAVIWYRNTESLFQTRQGNIIPTNTTEYDAVSGRISVTTKDQTHTVMLQINASLDDGSVWRCGVDGYYSNNLTVEVLIPTTTVATPGNGHTPENKLVTTAARNGSTSTDKSPSCIPNVYAIVGSSAGTVIVCFLVVFAVICIKHIAGSRNTTNPGTSGLIPDDIGSAVNVHYSNIDIITEATGTDVNNQYSNSNVITGTTRSDVNNQYSNSSVITGTTRSDVNNQYCNSSVITGTTRSDANNEYSTADVPSNEDRCLTDTDEYITATFDSTEHID